VIDIAVCDYGAGNTRSVISALGRLAGFPRENHEIDMPPRAAKGCTAAESACPQTGRHWSQNPAA